MLQKISITNKCCSFELHIHIYIYIYAFSRGIHQGILKNVSQFQQKY